MNNFDLFLSHNEQDEEFEDEFGFETGSISEAVVSSNDWTTETIIRQIEKGNIILNPDFQRRDAWTQKKKSQFIESLVLGLPIPQIVLAEAKEQKGKYIVLDGKQRLLALRQFTIPENDSEYTKFKLTNLDIRRDLNKKTYEDFKNNIDLIDDFSSFENQPIRTVVIKNWKHEDFLYLVFLRLNTGSVPLSTQELRQALHPGDFIRYLNKESVNSIELKEMLNLELEKSDFRMRDTELLLRYFAFKNFLTEYTGNLKSFLDLTCERLNKSWDEMQAEIESQLILFQKAHKRIKEIFKENAYKKWNGNKYESRFNRAIFDVMMLTFSTQEVLNRTNDRSTHDNIENGFRRLCEDNRKFLDSITSTTKSIQSTQNRINIWLEFLNRTLGIDLSYDNLTNYS